MGKDCPKLIHINKKGLNLKYTYLDWPSEVLSKSDKSGISYSK